MSTGARRAGRRTTRRARMLRRGPDGGTNASPRRAGSLSVNSGASGASEDLAASPANWSGSSLVVFRGTGGASIRSATVSVTTLFVAGVVFFAAVLAGVVFFAAVLAGVVFFVAALAGVVFFAAVLAGPGRLGSSSGPSAVLAVVLGGRLGRCGLPWALPCRRRPSWPACAGRVVTGARVRGHDATGRCSGRRVRRRIPVFRPLALERQPVHDLVAAGDLGHVGDLEAHPDPAAGRRGRGEPDPVQPVVQDLRATAWTSTIS